MKRVAGFTLVELLLTLCALALMAALGWRGLDSMVRAQAALDRHADDVVAMQAGLGQWTADLDALVQLPRASALDWNGRVLRLTRHAMVEPPDGVRVVAWTRRQGLWLRWQSRPLATRGDLERAWQQAELWSHTPGQEERALEVAVAPLQGWEIFYYRGNSWSHPLSSDATEGDASSEAPVAGVTSVVPDGVRLVLDLPPGHAVAGRIVRDWASPRLAGGRS